MLRTQSLAEEIEPFESIAHLCEQSSVSMPVPIINLIDTNLLAASALPIKELMIIPHGASSCREALELGASIYETWHKLQTKKKSGKIKREHKNITAPKTCINDLCDMVVKAIEMQQAEGMVSLALNVSASGIYDQNSGLYSWYNDRYRTEDMIEMYNSLIDTYPLYFIEDGFAASDTSAWKSFNAQLGESVHIVGGDIFVSSPHRIAVGIEQELANAATVSSSQIGTITEALQALALCKEHDLVTIVGAGVGANSDDLLVDMAVGINTGHIKIGNINSENSAYIDRLLSIEDALLLSLLNT